MRSIILLVTLLSYTLIYACETSSALTPHESGEVCSANTNSYGRCNVNQTCENGECKDLSVECKGSEEMGSENTNGFGYCLEGHNCVDSHCVQDLSCSSVKACKGNMQCVSGQCKCGTNTCGDAETCCGDYCINLSDKNMSACGQCLNNYQDCNNDRSDGCEQKLQHMTSCNTCLSGYANCNQLWVDGCEQEFINSSACDTCDTGFANCNGDWNDGCEQALTNHMSACETCNSGFANCNDDWADGCEQQLINMSACETCKSGFANCNANWNDGCEQKLINMSDCETCKSGFANCNTNWSDGCEINLLTDSKHCGFCNNKCNGCNKGFCKCALLSCAIGDACYCAPGEHCVNNECRCGSTDYSCGNYSVGDTSCPSLHYCDADRVASPCVCRDSGGPLYCNSSCQGMQCAAVRPPLDVAGILKKTPFLFIFEAWINAMSDYPIGYTFDACSKTKP